jgi:hypothetical protein
MQVEVADDVVNLALWSGEYLGSGCGVIVEGARRGRQVTRESRSVHSLLRRRNVLLRDKVVDALLLHGDR